VRPHIRPGFFRTAHPSGANAMKSSHHPSRGWRSDRSMRAFDPNSPPQHIRDRCPRCGSPDGVLNLLTSMIRYFTCPHCDCRWHVVLSETVEDVSGDRDVDAAPR
jgi:ribosomal protein S14